ncbi:hypothetical protein JCM16303_003857 [Sporobolomyces ruberrimus]
MRKSISPTCRSLLITLGAREVITTLLGWIDPEDQHKPRSNDDRVTQWESKVFEPTIVPADFPVTTFSPVSLSTPLAGESEKEEKLPTSLAQSSLESPSSDLSSQDEEVPQLAYKAEELPEPITICEEPSIDFPTSFTPSYYFKLDVLDTWIDRNASSLIAEDELELRQFALNLIEEDEARDRAQGSIESESLVSSKLQICSNNVWRKIERRLVDALEEHLAKLSSSRSRSLRPSKKLPRPRLEPDVDVQFIDLPSLRRPELRRSNSFFSSPHRSGTSSSSGLWAAQGDQLRKIVVVREAFRRTFGACIAIDEGEEGDGKLVPTSIMLEQLDTEMEEDDEEEGGDTTSIPLRWSDLVDEAGDDEAFFAEPPIFRHFYLTERLA